MWPGPWVSPGPGPRNLAVPSTRQLTLARQWVLTLARASSSAQDKWQVADRDTAATRMFV